MPSIRIGPYGISFYEYDLREPPHVHVRRERKQAKFWLAPVTLARNNGFSRHELKLDEICTLANELHGKNTEFDAEAWGWPVHYDPELPEPPVDSQLTFTPATFWIGVWPLWYVSLTWENGRANAPKMLVGQDNVVK